MDKRIKILGGEPAAVIGVIQALLVTAGLLLGWTSDQVGALALVVVAVGDTLVALATRATLLGVVVGLLKATIVAAAAFGFHLSPEATAAVIGLATAVIGLFQRTQTSAVGYLPAAVPVTAVPVPPHPVE